MIQLDKNLVKGGKKRKGKRSHIHPGGNFRRCFPIETDRKKRENKKN